MWCQPVGDTWLWKCVPRKYLNLRRRPDVNTSCRCFSLLKEIKLILKLAEELCYHLAFSRATPVHWITVPTRKVGWDSLQSWGRQLDKAGCWGGWEKWEPAPWTSAWALWSSVWYAMGWGSGILINTGPATDRNRTWIWARSKPIRSTGQLITRQQDTWNSSCCVHLPNPCLTQAAVSGASLISKCPLASEYILIH